MIDPAEMDRLMATIRQLVRAELSRLTYGGTYDYTVTAYADGLLTAQPTDTTTALPPITASLRGCMLAETVTPSVGGHAMVRFLNYSPTRPVIVGLTSTPVDSAIDASGAANLGPTAAAVVLADGDTGVARLGDQVTFFLPPNSPISGTLDGNPWVGTITIASAFNGLITRASPTVGAG